MAVGVGILGCGNISGIYFKNLCSFHELRVVACADLDMAKAASAGLPFGVPAVTPDHLLADPEIQIIVNLTVPLAHFDLNKQILLAGKHVYVEKPLAPTRTDAQETLKLAERKDLQVGCAPDTILGAGIQTCRDAIDEGLIGDIVGANAFMTCHGHESWHPAPVFYYEPGGGPLFDMGPYYLSTLVNLIGPVSRVSGSAAISFPTRTITSQPLAGTQIEVKTPTHIVGVLDFANGAIAQVTMSFDVWSARLPCLEIYGARGTLSVPDPNGFGGPVELWTPEHPTWTELPLTHPYAENSRGLGVLDMALAIQQNRPVRASGALALHVVDVMQSILEASDSGEYRHLATQVERPMPMPKRGF